MAIFKGAGVAIVTPMKENLREMSMKLEKALIGVFRIIGDGAVVCNRREQPERGYAFREHKKSLKIPVAFARASSDGQPECEF